MKLENLRIGVRLGYGFSLLLALMLILVAIGLAGMNTLHDRLEGIVSHNGRQIQAVSEMRQAVMVLSVAVRNLALVTEDADRKKSAETIVEARNIYSAAQASFARLGISQQEQAILNTISAKEKAAQVLTEKTVQLSYDNQLDEVIPVILNELQPAQQAWLDAMQSMVAFQQGAAKQAAESGYRWYSNARIVLLSLTGLALLIAGVTAYFITKSITRHLHTALAVAERVADGDLTSEVEASHRDETGQLIHALVRMNNNLKDIVQNVLSGTEFMQDASSKIASGSVGLASRTESQALALHQTAVSMKDLAELAVRNAEDARTANDMASAARGTALDGMKVVKDVIDTMAAINQSAKQIADITSVIDVLSFQTNLLALNASVEAARAGEQGRGFAVVAAEVRNLAQRSATAAREINALIKRSVSMANEGSVLVAKAGTTIQHVVDTVENVSEVVSKVTSSSEQQRRRIAEVDGALKQIGQATGENASEAAVASEAAEALTRQAGALADTVGLFKMAAPSTAQQRSSWVHEDARPAERLVALEYQVEPLQRARSTL